MSCGVSPWDWDGSGNIDTFIVVVVISIIHESLPSVVWDQQWSLPPYIKVFPSSPNARMSVSICSLRLCHEACAMFTGTEQKAIEALMKEGVQRDDALKALITAKWDRKEAEAALCLWPKIKKNTSEYVVASGPSCMPILNKCWYCGDDPPDHIGRDCPKRSPASPDYDDYCCSNPG